MTGRSHGQRLTSAQITRAEDMISDGYSNQQIADAIGFTRKTIQKRWPIEARALEADRETELHCCPAARHMRILLDASHVTPSGCWRWDQHTDPDGYGNMKHAGSGTLRAHRFAYEALIRPIPPGLVIDHLCRNRSCVNPEHLQPVTAYENTMRGWGVSSYNARKTTCARGHNDFNLLNNGERWCASCLREDKRARRDRNAAFGLTATDARHGTVTGYSEYRCRCGLCAQAKANSRKAYR